MIELLFEQLFGNGLFTTTGSAMLGCLIIMFLIFLGLLYCNLEFDFALVMISPIPYAFYRSGYLEVWIASLFIIIPLGIGIYSIWLKFSNKQ